MRLGTLLVSIGAIFTFAVSASVPTLRLNILGWILMVAGVGTIVVSFVRSEGTRSGSRIVEDPVTHERLVNNPPNRELVENQPPQAPRW